MHVQGVQQRLQATIVDFFDRVRDATGDARASVNADGWSRDDGWRYMCLVVSWSDNFGNTREAVARFKTDDGFDLATFDEELTRFTERVRAEALTVVH